MKTFRLFVAIALAFASISVQSQNILFRASDADIETYRSALKTSFARTTPMHLLETRLNNTELPLFLQKELDEVLLGAAAEPMRATALFEEYYRKLEKEPRSAALRETMQMVLDRMAISATPEQQREILDQQQSLQQIDGTKTNSQHSQLLNREIAERIRLLRTRPGGEDAELFLNGVKWNSAVTLTPDTRAQWIVISSQWRPRLLTGRWSEVASQWEEGFLNWIEGSCKEPRFQDLIFAQNAIKEAVFASGCLASEESPSSQKASVPAQSSFFSNIPKPVLWGAGLLATGLVVLSLSGKKLQQRR